jgi:CBS domain-containing protein
MTVKEVMTEKVHALRETDTLRDVRELMERQRIRHVPIISRGKRFQGLVSHRDLLGATISGLAGVDPDVRREIDSCISVKEIMRTDLRTVSTSTPLKEAASILLQNKYGCLPVVEDEVLVGIITEADFLKLTIELIEILGTRRGL